MKSRTNALGYCEIQNYTGHSTISQQVRDLPPPAKESANSEPMNDSTLTTPQSLIDEALTTLHTQKGIWVALGVSERVRILDEVRADMLAVADRWICE